MTTLSDVKNGRSNQYFFTKSDFERLSLLRDDSLTERLLDYVARNQSQLHRYPEEEYEDVIRNLSQQSGWPLEKIFISKSAPEAFEFLIEMLIGPGDRVFIKETHPYLQIISHQVTLRKGQALIAESPDINQTPKLMFTCDEISSSLLQKFPGTPIVLLNPSENIRHPQVVQLYEWTAPPVTQNPIPVIFGYGEDLQLVQAVRKIQEPFHIPTQLLDQMIQTIPTLSFPKTKELPHTEGTSIPLEAAILKPIQSIQPYIPGKGIKAMARELNMPASAFCKLASNEHPFGMSTEVIDHLKALLERWKNQPLSYQKAWQLLQTRVVETLGISGIMPQQVLFGTGSVELIKAIIKTFVDPTSDKEGVLYPAFPFAMYPFQTTKRLAAAHTVSLEADRQLSLSHFIEEILATQPQVIFLANPRNPLGTGLTDITPLIEALTSNQVLVVDEAYLDFIREEMGPEIYPDAVKLLLAYPDKNIIALRTFSKSHALASFRLGYAITRSDLAEKINATMLPCPVDPLTLAAGIASLETPGVSEKIQETARFVIQAKKAYYQIFQELGLPHLRSYSNFIFFETGEKFTSKELFNALVKQGVIIRPVTETTARVNIGAPHENTQFLNAIRRAYQP